METVYDYHHCSFCKKSAEDYFLEQIDSSPPLVSKEEVDKFLPENLQFNSAEDLFLWEQTASKEEKEKRENGIENIFSLVERRLWLSTFLQLN